MKILCLLKKWRKNVIQTIFPTIEFTSVILLLVLKVVIIKNTVSSDFFSANTTLSCGISAGTYNEAENLYNKLVAKKDYIDHIFESQPIYTTELSFMKTISIHLLLVGV